MDWLYYNKFCNQLCKTEMTTIVISILSKVHNRRKMKKTSQVDSFVILVSVYCEDCIFLYQSLPRPTNIPLNHIYIYIFIFICMFLHSLYDYVHTKQNICRYHPNYQCLLACRAYYFSRARTFEVSAWAGPCQTIINSARMHKFK